VIVEELNTEESMDLAIARELIDVVPKVMHRIRFAMRSLAKGQMTIAQLRILARLYQDNYTITDLSEWQGVSAPAMSKMIDILEKKAWVERVPNSQDRRQVGLRLTPEGKKIFLNLRKSTRARMAERVNLLSEADKAVVNQALKILGNIYTQ
jgi:DNA-binding MarR family transcriptional regulator